MTAPVAFEVDFASVQKVLERAPQAAYKHLREFLFVAFHSHRTQWLRVKGSKFGRGGRGIKVHRIGEKAPTTYKSVHYDLPKERTAKSEADARKKLAKLGAEMRTGSVVLEVHEFGKTIRAKSRRMMVIPIKTRPGDLGKWKRKNPSKRLRWIPQGSKGALLFEVTGKRKKRWKLRFVMRPKVVNKPKLKLYDTWQRLAPIRNRQWSRAATDMLDSIEEGKG